MIGYFLLGFCLQVFLPFYFGFMLLPLNCVIFVQNTWVSVPSSSCIHPCHLCATSIIFLGIRHLNKGLFPIEIPITSLQYHYGLSRVLLNGGCLVGVDFFVGYRSSWKDARKWNGNFVWCGGKKSKKKRNSLHFFGNCTFTCQFSTRDVSMPGSPRFCQFQRLLAPGVQGLQRLCSSPAPHSHALAWNPLWIPAHHSLPAPLWVLGPSLPLCSMSNLLDLQREGNIPSRTFFPSVSLCPIFNLLDAVDFFFLKFLYKI